MQRLNPAIALTALALAGAIPHPIRPPAPEVPVRGSGRRYVRRLAGRIRVRDRALTPNPDGSIDLPASPKDAPGFWRPWGLLFIPVAAPIEAVETTVRAVPTSPTASTTKRPPAPASRKRRAR